MVAYVIAVVPIVWVSRSIIIYRIVLSNFIFSFRNKLILILILILIQHSPYFSDDDLLQSSIHTSNGLSILSLNCQSLHAKFDYIKLLTEKFAASNCPLQVLCLQESWFSSETDLSSYVIPRYHTISSGHYASTHGGLVIYLHEKWS